MNKLIAIGLILLFMGCSEYEYDISGVIEKDDSMLSMQSQCEQMCVKKFDCGFMIKCRPTLGECDEDECLCLC